MDIIISKEKCDVVEASHWLSPHSNRDANNHDFDITLLNDSVYSVSVELRLRQFSPLKPQIRVDN
jgi:hypothetical protein